MKTDKSISVFFPAYNDSGTIASMVIAALLTLRELTDDHEVIVINDGSADFTPQILDELARQYKEVRIVHHARNKGYGGALRSGFAAASKDLVFYTDGDAQYDVRELKLLLAALDDDIDLVNGYKIERHDPLHRVVIGKLYQYCIRHAFHLTLRDVDCDFRLIRRSVFDKVELKSNSGVICVELMTRIQLAGFRLAEVPVHHYHRAYGKSQFFNFPRIYHTLVNLAELWRELMLSKPGERTRPESTGSEVARESPDEAD
ncbi:MAG: glycosyltransferase family 2 protein [Dehalococcoidia bacterium]|nr:glycosyltransferase family 2 protein [Dehalococcoidia bacterium]